jgi:hypothetical protein
MLGCGAPQPGQKPDGGGEAEPKHSIYVAAWMRKPGDPEYEEDEGETAGSREASTPREPVMSDPEPPPQSLRPAAVPQSATVHNGRSIEPAEPPYRVRGAGFGRFQRL